MQKWVVVVALTLLSAGVSAQQVPQPDTLRAPVPAGTVVFGSVMGSLTGTFVGFFGGAAMGMGGGSDSSLAGALLGAPIGGALGSALGIHIASGRRAPGGALVGSALVGVLGGIGTMLLLDRLSENMEAGGFYLSFAVGQGFIAGALASGQQRR